MPGGSVNGRPFRESRDSFGKTGVPCGNPKRYHSQDVVRMSGQPIRIKDLSGPLEDIETEGQRQMKNLLDKQLNTKTTIKEQLEQRRNFSRGTLYKPATDDVSGILDLSDYKVLEHHDSRISELRLCGLTDEEIELKLLTDNGYPEEKKPRLGQDPLYVDNRLAEINKKIESHQKSLQFPDKFSCQQNIGRHAMELEKSLVKDNVNTKHLSTMLLKSQTASKFPHPDDPMNHLPEILEKVAGKHLFEKKRHRKRHKQRTVNDSSHDKDNKLEERDSDEDDCMNLYKNSSSEITEIIGCKTKEELLMEQVSEADLGIAKNASTTTDSFQNELEEIKTGSVKSTVATDKNYIVHCKTINSMVKQIPEAEITINRLSLEEIRKIQKFVNYEEGEPNNVLYLKNLPNKVTENELGSLFLRYQTVGNSPITFRILTGRMKGQAFVTFDRTETATQALKLINGYKFKDRPIIIQYGKKY